MTPYLIYLGGSKTKNLITDERADSMIIVVIAMGVLLFGLTYTILSISHNVPIVSMNAMIDSGTLSTDTVTHFQTMNDMWKASPFFFIIGLVLWCFERGKGESVTSGTYFSYLVLMIITLTISMYLVWGFGLSLDALVTEFESNPQIMNYSAEWDVTATKQVLMAGMYYAAMLPGFIGSVLYMLHPILKQRENNFLENPPETKGGEYITNYSMEQM